MVADGDIVYSTHPEIFQKEKTAGGLPPLGQVIKLRPEKGNRGGKTVTVFFGFQASDKQLKNLLKEMQKVLGTGGTAKKGCIEVQGDHIAKASSALEKLGYAPKRAGG
jgi:translation initiation factor 1